MVLAPSELVGTPARIWIIRVVGKLIVSLHLTGLVRYRSPSPYRKSNRSDEKNKALAGCSPYQPSPSRGRGKYRAAESTLLTEQGHQKEMLRNMNIPIL